MFSFRNKMIIFWYAFLTKGLGIRCENITFAELQILFVDLLLEGRHIKNDKI